MSTTAITESGRTVTLERIRDDRRGVPYARFDWLTGELVTGYVTDEDQMIRAALTGAAAYPAHPAPGVRVPADAPVGTRVRATGAIGTVRGTIAGWSPSMLGMRPIVAYVKYGREHRSAMFDAVAAC